MRPTCLLRILFGTCRHARTTSRLAHGILLTGALLVAIKSEGQAAEYAFSSYGLGSVAFAAGLTPPPGIYVTTAVGVYNADIGKPVRFGGVTINAGAELEGFSNGWNILYVPSANCSTATSGWPSPSPLATSISWRISVPLSRETAGWGFGDITTRAQLGWQQGDVSHLVSVQAVAPTGRWQPGFTPIIG